MNDIEKLNEKLIGLEDLYGIFGVFLLLLLLIAILSIWVYHKTFLQGAANSFFKRSIAAYKSELISEIGDKFITQTGELQKNISELKSDLHLVSGQRINFLNERRNSLVNLYTSYTDWLNTIIDVSPYDIDGKNLELIESFNSEMNKTKHNFNKALAYYDIFGRDKELNRYIKVMLVETAKLQGERIKQLAMVKNLLIEKETLKVKLEKIPTPEKEQYDTAFNELKGKYKEIENRIQKTNEIIMSNFKQLFLNKNEASIKISELIKASFE